MRVIVTRIVTTIMAFITQTMIHNKNINDNDINNNNKIVTTIIMTITKIMIIKFFRACQLELQLAQLLS